MRRIRNECSVRCGTGVHGGYQYYFLCFLKPAVLLVSLLWHRSGLMASQEQKNPAGQSCSVCYHNPQEGTKAPPPPLPETAAAAAGSMATSSKAPPKGLSTYVISWTTPLPGQKVWGRKRAMGPGARGGDPNL